MKNLTTKERLQYFVKEQGYGRNKFEEYVGIASGYLSSKSNTVTSDTIERIIKKFPDLSLKWLLSGEGDMIINNSYSVDLGNIPTPKPYINMASASCGVPDGFSLAIKKSDCELISIPFIGEYDFSIRAKGDSMINRSNPARSIAERDIITCKIWQSRSHIRWGEVYALATTEGVVIKKIEPSEKDECVKCVSFNVEDNFKPYDLPLNEIFDWALVVGVIRINMW